MGAGRQRARLPQRYNRSTRVHADDLILLNVPGLCRSVFNGEGGIDFKTTYFDVNPRFINCEVFT